VRDLFEVVDHRQLVGDCFSDFMEVTIKAFLKLKDEPIIEATLPITAAPSQIKPASGKKFTSEPTSMKDVIKSIKQNKVEKNLPEKRVKLSATNEKKKSESSPEKESKNARKKRERKEQAKKAKSEEKLKEDLSSEEDGALQKGGESDSSIVSKHDAFIKSISQSINSYSLEKASQDASSQSDSQADGRISSSSLDSSSSSITIVKKPQKMQKKKDSLDSLDLSSDDL
jgi:hypothetical protein